MIAMRSFRPLRGWPTVNRSEFPALTDGAIACRPFGTQECNSKADALGYDAQFSPEMEIRQSAETNRCSHRMQLLAEAFTMNEANTQRFLPFPFLQDL